MSDVFISYARSTAKRAQAVAEALRGLGYGVWLDDEIPAHRAYADVIEERLKAARAVVVIWSAEAVRSQWVQSEADRAREEGKLVQLSLDDTRLPMPFDRIQCADLNGWTGDLEAPGWRKVAASIADLVGETAARPAVSSAPPPLPSKPSIAVLPFVDMTGAAGQDYFADGMVVEIVEALSRIRSIFVIASGSSLSFRGKTVGPQEAARQLGVRYVLEGSVRKAGGRVRIGVQLIDATDGAQIWTHRFEDTLDDIFALQDKVALAVAGKIEPAVLQAEIGRASGRPTDNMGSYDLYLRALPLIRGFARTDTLRALDLVNRAIELDPEFGMALCFAGTCHYFLETYGWADDRASNRRRGIEMAHRALKAAGDDAYVLAGAAAVVARLEGDPVGALALVERAIDLNPGSSRAWMMSGLVRMRAGQSALAIEHIERSMRLDPLSPNRASQLMIMGIARFQQARFDEVVPLMRSCSKPTTLAATPFLPRVAGIWDRSVKRWTRSRGIEPCRRCPSMSSRAR